MDLAALSWLRSAPGQELLALLAGRELAEADLLREISRLRGSYPPELARAAVEQALLRRRARAKFPAADQLYFTREALEQASSAPVAHHRARRLAPSGHVADLCCGIGGDALALAAGGARVTAVDRDELRLAIAAANAEALGMAGRITFVQADLLTMPPPLADALFCDPGRRAGDRRRFHVEQYEPPLSRVLAWRERTPALAVKLAPGVSVDELASAGPCEIEFVSLDGELKEATLWCGPLAAAGRRATVIKRIVDCELQTCPAAFVLAQARVRQTHEPRSRRIADLDHAYEVFTIQSPICDPQSARAATSPPLAYLYEPDPAVIRAGLVAELAAQLGAAQLDPTIAYLTAPGLVATPFARAWPVIEWLPFSLKRLRARLRELDAGPVTVKKRGSPLDTDALARKLSGDGPRPLVVALTQVQGRPAALICHGV